MGRFLIAALLGALVTLPQGEDHATFQAKNIGQVKVTSSFPAGGFPTVRFQDTTGHFLYSISVGSSEPDIFRIDEDTSSSSPDLKNLGPSKLIYFVLDSKAQPTAVLAVAMYTGGSDCEYVPALVGPIGGKLTSWLQQEPVVNGQGGFYVGDLGGRRGFGLAAWSFIWEDGAHWGSHRYNVRLYRVDPESGTSSLVFKADTKRKYVSGIDALKEFGLRYQNILSKSPALGC
jgi:hypothetical protein